MNAFEVLGLTALLALVVVATIRVRLGFWALPLVGRQPFLTTFVVSWALTAIGYLLAELAPRSGTGVLFILIASASAVLLVLRGREITNAGRRDPSGGLRPWIVAGHGLFILFVIALMITRQI